MNAETAARKARRQRATARTDEVHANAKAEALAGRQAANRARQAASPEGKRLAAEHADRISIIAHQPLPKHDPNTLRSRHILLPTDVTYTERQSFNLVGWAGVVAKCGRMDNSGTGHNARTPIR